MSFLFFLFIFFSFFQFFSVNFFLFYCSSIFLHLYFSFCIHFLFRSFFSFFFFLEWPTTQPWEGSTNHSTLEYKEGNLQEGPAAQQPEGRATTAWKTGKGPNREKERPCSNPRGKGQHHRKNLSKLKREASANLTPRRPKLPPWEWWINQKKKKEERNHTRRTQPGHFSVARPNSILHFLHLCTHFFPCLNPLFKNGSFLSVILWPSKMIVSFLVSFLLNACCECRKDESVPGQTLATPSHKHSLRPAEGPKVGNLGF